MGERAHVFVSRTNDHIIISPIFLGMGPGFILWLNWLFMDGGDDNVGWRGWRFIADERMTVQGMTPLASVDRLPFVI